MNATRVHTIGRRRLSEVVASRIKDYILDGGLVEGDRLPTEQQMADMFGVSRVSVREATKALSFLGIIRSAPRRGLTLGHVDMARVTEFLGFHFALTDYPREQLLQTRIIIEAGAFAQSMESIAADPQVYERLVKLIDPMRQASTSDAFIAADLAFHRALLQASRIEPLIAFNGVLEVFFQRFRDEVKRARRAWSAGIDGHQKILDALRRRQLVEAQALLRDHLAHYKPQS